MSKKRKINSENDTSVVKKIKYNIDNFGSQYEYIISLGIYSFVTLNNNDTCYIWGKREKNHKKPYPRHMTHVTQELICDHEGYTFDLKQLSLPYKQIIESISCGYNHIICLSNTGKLYGLGENNMSQVGVGSKTPYLYRFHEIAIPYDQGRPIMISAGYHHNICLLDSLICYGWGWNARAQLGSYIGTLKIDTPIKLVIPNNEKVIKVSCGYTSSLFVTKSNKCYEAGDIFGFRLVHLFLPLCIYEDNEPIKQISCGFTCSSIVTETGKCFIWGCGQHYQLGFGNNEDQLTPKLIKLPDNETVKQISCGKNYVLCVTHHNTCYGWGRNNYGQIQPHNRSQKIFKTPTFISIKTVQVLSSYTCSILIDESDEYFVFGETYFKNLTGCKFSIPSNIKRQMVVGSNWKKELHMKSSKQVKEIVFTCLILHNDKKNRYPDCLFRLLPKHLLLYIMEFLPLY